MTGNNKSSELCPHCASEHRGCQGDCERKPLITLRHVSMAWENRCILDDVSLVIREGDFIAITGPNGGGKTTLLKIILRLLKPSEGTVIVDEPGLRIGYLPQKNMIDSHFPISVSEVIASGMLALKDIDNKERTRRFEATIQAMGLEEHRNKAIGTLSGGQLQRALLGRAIISRPSLLVLDEPLSYIDKRFEAQLYDIISELSKTTTIILVSHEMSTIAGMANRHFIVDKTLHACLAHHHYVRTECDD